MIKNIRWEEYTGEILEEGFYLIADVNADSIFRCYKIVRYGHEIHNAFTHEVVGYNQFYTINDDTWDMDFHYPKWYAKINKPVDWRQKGRDYQWEHCDNDV